MFLAGDFKQFHKIVNDSKVLKVINVDIQSIFKIDPDFKKSWVFNNKAVVLDFIIDSNKVAFDLEVNEKGRYLKVWVFSRNKPNSLDFLANELAKKEKEKFLIFDGKLEEKIMAVEEIKKYLEKIRLLLV